MSKNNFKVEPADKNNTQLVERVYQIYSESIAVREQKPKSKFIECFKKSNYFNFVIRNELNEIVGFTMFFTDPPLKFSLLEYMAVDQKFRSAGLGSKLLAESFEHCFKIANIKQVIIELDSPQEACADQKIREKRFQFYARLGCKEIDGLNYILPLPGEGALPQMILLMYEKVDSKEISSSELQQVVSKIYTEVYDCSPSDPRLSQMFPEGRPKVHRLIATN